ncbi:MAG: HK97 gp10 family phage protein [Paracoccaceae bacterium]|jgi:hypothetical protein
MTAKQFTLQLNKEIADTEEKIEDAIALIALDSLRGVVRKSPVDTGRFRGNWIVSKNAANTTSSQVTDKNGGQTITKGSGVIDTFKMNADSRIIIQNNLPYANRLENGWSKQAPNGMVALTVAEMQRKYRNVLI